jgi:tRNA (adenine37-N6)-methyltransferase
MTSATIELRPVGHIETDESRGVYRLHVHEPYRAALRGLGSCNTAIVLWWADRIEGERDLVVELPYAPGVVTGVFANRDQSRPNPICLTTTFIVGVDEEAGTVDLAWIDALDQTPLLDIKPYLPMADRVMSARYPEWLEGFPESMEDSAEFFADPENLARFS